MTINTTQIAEICHEANRTYSKMIGETSKRIWHLAGPDQQASVIAGVEYLLANAHAGWKAAHDSWVLHKVAAGWIHGEEYSESGKIHPNLVHFHELSYEQRAKDQLFVGIVDALREQAVKTMTNTELLSHVEDDSGC